MDPSLLPWIALALQLAGTLILLGGKNQKIRDIEKDVDEAHDEIEMLRNTKLAVTDYDRERDNLNRVLESLGRRVEVLEGRGVRR